MKFEIQDLRRGGRSGVAWRFGGSLTRAVLPGWAICVTMLAFQTFGEALRRALDPREAEMD